MKNLLLILTTTGLFIISSCQFNQSSKNDTEKSLAVKDSSIQFTQLDLKVNGMTCEGCEKTIETGVQQLNGIADINASYTDSVVTIKCDTSKVTLNDIKNKIADLGYQVQ